MSTSELNVTSSLTLPPAMITLTLMPVTRNFHHFLPHSHDCPPLLQRQWPLPVDILCTSASAAGARRSPFSYILYSVTLAPLSPVLANSAVDQALHSFLTRWCSQCFETYKRFLTGWSTEAKVLPEEFNRLSAAFSCSKLSSLGCPLSVRSSGLFVLLEAAATSLP